MCVQNRKMVETCLQHSWSKPRLDSPSCWEGPLPCCTCRRIDVIQLANWTTMTLAINCRSTGCRSWTSLKISWKQRKGTPRMSTWNVLNWATRAVILTSPLNFDAKSSTSFLFIFCLKLAGLKPPPPNPPGSAVPVVAVVGKREVKIATTK